eukprot:GEMP01036097.1.p1 GENE.GEMP01036097.1~~GEMP01036097.1.p1  ORF type:complete len:381 (+),score=46.11 GEMP01036097.1:27-1145(+)
MQSIRWVRYACTIPNIPKTVQDKVGQNLHKQPSHPIQLIRSSIEEYFSTTRSFHSFCAPDDPFVSTKQCFDDLLVPQDHVSRRPNDTYYRDANTVLRTHTSVYESEFIERVARQNGTAQPFGFLLTGDCYRRDEIDRTHFPIFHQTEGVRIFPGQGKDVAERDLRESLEGLARHLFGNDVVYRWTEDSFPWTDPSFELEVYNQDRWVEVLGSGVVKDYIIERGGLDPETNSGWAFGLGLDRLAMLFFQIPDIRLLWSSDPRFLDQFTVDSLERKTVFESFSKYPPVEKDVSMWVPDDFEPNDFFEIVRDEGGEMVESVTQEDSFVHPQTNRQSRMYRITYRSMSRTLMHEEVNEIQNRAVARLVTSLGVELR